MDLMDGGLFGCPSGSRSVYPSVCSPESSPKSLLAFSGECIICRERFECLCCRRVDLLADRAVVKGLDTHWGWREPVLIMTSAIVTQ